MKKISVTQARNNLAEILNQVAYKTEQFVIERRGEPVAVLLGPGFAEDSNIGQKDVNPSETAGEIDLGKRGISIEELFEQIKEPYDKKSLLGC